MHKYKSLGRVGEGTFSEVLKAQSIKTGTFMAIKCMKHGEYTNICLWGPGQQRKHTALTPPHPTPSPQCLRTWSR